MVTTSKPQKQFDVITISEHLFAIDGDKLRQIPFAFTCKQGSICYLLGVSLGCKLCSKHLLAIDGDKLRKISLAFTCKQGSIC
jgi:hypothetical protein